VPFGLGFFVINLPFYVLSLMRMGWRFHRKDLLRRGARLGAVGNARAISSTIGKLEPVYAAIFGGL
jgi:uncharacterized membrane-anchored protein YitT (DUF2179 family)